MLLWVAESCPTPCDPWTVAHQAPLSVGFSRQEHWSGLPLPSPGDLPDPGMEAGSPIAGRFFTEPPGKDRHMCENTKRGEKEEAAAATGSNKSEESGDLWGGGGEGQDADSSQGIVMVQSPSLSGWVLGS